MKLRRNSEEMGVAITNPQTEYVPQLSRPAKEINWDFSQGGLRDWVAANDLESLRIQDGALVVKSIGSDPYMVSMFATIDASAYSEIVVRMRTTRGKHAQIFWSTGSSPVGEATSASFQIDSDGRFHDYVIPVGQHAKWQGTITSLRLDPTDSARSEIAVESITGR